MDAMGEKEKIEKRYAEEDVSNAYLITIQFRC
jgi:hypothetical protein